VTTTARPPALILIRHGESEFNVRGLMTGWADAPLTAKGRQQAHDAGRELSRTGAVPDIVYASLLRRAEQTTGCLLQGWEHAGHPVRARWQLNERHLGQLQGLDKHAIKERWGNPQRHRWRSDPMALPPPLASDDLRHPSHDPRFGALSDDEMPAAERICDVRRRVLMVWGAEIVPQLYRGRGVTVVAHRDSLRVLIAAVEGLGAGVFADISVPHATPRAYRICGRTLTADGPGPGCARQPVPSDCG
jgi:2,3-bisphosphoglycerate-dependent phosphoglycerate mutase